MNRGLRIGSGGRLGTLGAFGIRNSGIVTPATPWYLAGGISSVNCVAAYQAIGAASLAASYINLNNPGTNDAVEVVAPTFDAATGWTFAADKRLKAVAHALDMTCIVRFSDANGGALFGLADRWSIIPSTGGSAVGYTSNNSVNVAPQQATGVLALSKTQGWRNGVEETAALTGRSETWPNSIGARTTNADASSADFFFVGKIQAIAFYNINLNTTQVAAITTRMNALP